MRTKLLALGMALALIGCGGGGSGSYAGAGSPPATGSSPSQPIAVRLPASDVHTPACHIIIYGDSIVVNAGYWLTEYPADKIRRLRPTWTVDDRAVAGQTGLLGATKAQDDPRPHGVVVVAEWGMNDLLQGDFFFDQLTAFLKKIKSEGSTPVVTGIVQHPGNLGFNATLMQLAINNGAAYADWGSVPITTVDGVHPNQAGVDLLIEDLVNTLDKECDHE